MPSEDPIDRLVRDHLDREAAGVDARAVLLRVKAARLAAPARPGRVARWAVRGGLGAAISAGVVLAVLVAGPEPKQAVAAETAEQLVEQARAAHSAPTDRCYEVVAEWDPIPLKRLKLDPVVRTSRLWTRGNQFWLETKTQTGQPVAWGQTADEKVWVALNRRRGLVYDPDEVGEPLTRYCDLMSLRVVATLGELLEQFDLFRRDANRPGEPVRVEARLRTLPDRPLPRFSHVELELDRDTKAIRSAVLKRMVAGEVVGTLRFTLAETADLPADRYDVRGHLDPDAVVLDRNSVPKIPWLARTDPRARFRDDVLRRLQGWAK